MNNLNFEAMTTRELRAYVLEHREDQQAIYELANRVEANGTRLKSIDELPEIIERGHQKNQ
jgi:hypothetical protein